MKINKNPGIFGKVFLYTVLIMVLLITISVGFFANQLATLIETSQKQQIVSNAQLLAARLDGRPEDEIVRIAKTSYEREPQFEFSIINAEYVILYATPNFRFLENYTTDPITNERLESFNVSGITLSNDITLYISHEVSAAVYTEFLKTTAFLFSALLLVGIFCAFLFARQMTKPIKKLASDTREMSNLNFVPAPTKRRDEIGQLSNDVYAMYEALKMEIEREKEMEESQRYFFSAASHELKTPIAAMSAVIEEMLDGIVGHEEYPEHLRKCMKMIIAQKKLISEILELVRLTDASVSSCPEQILFYATINSLLPTYQPLAEAKEQSIIVNIPEDLTFSADRKQLDRVLSNLLMNAIENAPQQAQIKIWSEPQDASNIRLYVLNTGTHIDEAIISKLFEPFYRLDTARSRNQGHSGLGLAIVKRTLDNMGVSFKLENTKDGVLFWMCLPLF